MNIYKGDYSVGAMMEMARRGLSAQQANMNITGNNISNVNTEGYTRQRVELKSSTALQAHDLNVESGVIADTTRRMRDTFFDLQIRNENPSFARWETEHHQLGQVENILNEPNDVSISKYMDQFFESWEDLSHDPESQSSRTVVRDAGESLAKVVNQIGANLDSLQSEIDDNMSDTANQINYYIKAMANQNKKIMLAEPDSAELSTLMDRRDLALDKLSELIDVTYEEKDDGNMLVYSNGIILVEASDYNQLLQDKKGDDALTRFYWNNENRDLKVTNGKMMGLYDVRDNVIPEMVDDLNVLVKKFVEETNRIHSSNFDLEGNSGNDFFDSDGTDIYSFAMNSEIMDDVKFIASSNKAGAFGNSDGALEMVELSNMTILNNDSATVQEYYNGVIMSHGTYTKEAERLAEMEETFVNQLQNRRNEVSEVDLDEELSNMIVFQQAYGASAKMISNVDEMIQKLLSMA